MDEAKIEIVERLKGIPDRVAMLGAHACTCLTKSPDVHMHDASCRYGNVMETADTVEATADEAALTIVALAKALEPFAEACEAACRGNNTMTMGEFGAIAAHHTTGVHFRLARSELQKLYSSEPSTGGDQ